MLLMQNDPFRDLDLFFRDARGTRQVPMDAYRRGDDVWVHMDLPGIGKESIDLDVERSVLSISATRNWQREDGDQLYMKKRPQGTLRRQVHLGDSLDVDAIEADFSDGVLTLRLPVSARAKPKKTSSGGGAQPAIDVESAPA